LSASRSTLLSWDEGKRRENIRKHGYDFADLAPAFDGRFCIVVEDRRREYGEERYNMLVEFAGRVVNVTFTPRSGGYHLISARPASRDERKVYHGIPR
jgi:uncharacterized DUF497 family protein